MGKAIDLNEFDRGHAVIARNLGTIISETVQLVDCLLSAVVNTYGKKINNGETSSRRQDVGSPLFIKEKGRWRLSLMEKQNRHFDTNVSKITLGIFD